MKVSWVTLSVFLPGLAKACLVVSGQISDGFETQFEVDAVDNGVQTCSFTCSGDIDDCNGSCIGGFSGSIDTDSNWESWLTFNYCNPSSCYSVRVDATNLFCENCCGGDIPCSCCQTTYYGQFFGCWVGMLSFFFWQRCRHTFGFVIYVYRK
jgi:hypothetical protein